MALTPVDIHNKQFNRSFRGYNEDEVETFLHQVMKDFEIITREKVDLGRETNELKSKLRHFTAMEETLNQSILIAQETAEEVKANAKKEAELIIKEAEKNADRIINDALSESRKAAMEMESLKRQSNIFKARLSMLVRAQLDMINTDDWENLEDVSMLGKEQFQTSHKPVAAQEELADLETQTAQQGEEVLEQAADEWEPAEVENAAVAKEEAPFVELEEVAQVLEQQEVSESADTKFSFEKDYQEKNLQNDLTETINQESYNDYEEEFQSEQTAKEAQPQEEAATAYDVSYEDYETDYVNEEEVIDTERQAYEGFQADYAKELESKQVAQDEISDIITNDYESYDTDYSNDTASRGEDELDFAIPEKGFERYQKDYSVEEQPNEEPAIQEEAAYTFEDSYTRYRNELTKEQENVEDHELEEVTGAHEELERRNPEEFTQARQLSEAALAHASAMEEPFAEDYSMDYSERSFYKYEKRSKD